METTMGDNDGEEEVNKEFPGFPPEIITEILLRLPAKSIGKFRCVSKLFCSLSSDQRFAKRHLDLTLRNDSARSSHRKLLVSSRNLYSVDLDSIGDIGDLDSVELDYPLKEDASIFDEMIRSYLRHHQLGGESCVLPKLDSNSCRRSWVEIIGSSNGLVCISPRENELYLYNPTTGESKKLPESPPPLESNEEPDQFQSYGFGFDDLSDDYKVVNLIDVRHGVMAASVYSLKSNSYRRICDLNYVHCYGFSSGVHFDNSIHWVFISHGERVLVLVAFDLRTEEFREMQLPDEGEDCDHRFKYFVVGNLNGCLCVVNSCYQEHDDIWVMNEYGDASSWRRIRISLVYRSMKPLCSTKNDEEVLLELNGDIVLYNFKTGASRNLGIRGVKPSDGFEANTYVESLISPNSYGI